MMVLRCNHSIQALMMVSIWLTSQCSQAVLERIMNVTTETTFADDMFDEISKIACGHGVAQARMASARLASLKRSNYGRVVLYVQDPTLGQSQTSFL